MGGGKRNLSDMTDSEFAIYCAKRPELFADRFVMAQVEDMIIGAMLKDNIPMYTYFDYERILELKLAVDLILEKLKKKECKNCQHAGIKFPYEKGGCYDCYDDKKNYLEKL